MVIPPILVFIGLFMSKPKFILMKKGKDKDKKVNFKKLGIFTLIFSILILVPLIIVMKKMKIL